MISVAAASSSSSLRRLFLATTTSRRSNSNLSFLLARHHPRTTSTRRTLTSSTKPAASASSSSSSLLAGDTGHKATHLHHHMTTLLVFVTPLYLFALPKEEDSSPSSSISIIDKGCGLLIATTLSAHSWIGMNYVATDYVPKLSKSLLGPARFLNLVLAGVTFVGMSKIALGEKGLRGTIMGLWRPENAAAAVVVAEEEEKTKLGDV